MEILALHLHHFMEYARLRGVQWDDMRRLIRNLPDDLRDELARVNEDDLYRVLRHIDDAMPDRTWGISCGHFISMKLLGLIYEISLQVTAIDEALHYLKSYMAAAMPLIETATNTSEVGVVIRFAIGNEQSALNRIILEYALAVVGRELKMMAGEGTLIQHYSPFHDDTYPPDWSYGEVFSVTFEPVILKAAIRNNSHLHVDILVPEYLKMIEQLKSDDSFAGKVKVTLLSMSDPQLPDIQTVSGALYLTPRTLQRRLVAEGVNFRKLLEDVKKQICGLLLRHDRYTITGIAAILGYSEPAAFIHSFQKWYGDSPERVRKTL
ncbi:helix-turn-helix domain-containing protein [Chitinophaga lutea]